MLPVLSSSAALFPSVCIAILASIYIVIRVHDVQMCTSGRAGYDRSPVSVQCNSVFNLLDREYDIVLPYVRG
ncbi:hypothetical protein F5X97DRAFT_232644 [Nemania serpens]|nr:hypothetical protein F5X97DRAFT_232644 [Nemania serpens]